MTAIDFYSLLKAERAKNKQKPTQSPQKIEFHFPLVSKPDDIAPFQIGTTPSIFYIPNWISTDEEVAIVRQIDTREDDEKGWQQLTRRRLKMYGGVPVNHSEGMLGEKIPEWVGTVFKELGKLEVFRVREKKLNHVLLNEYQDGMGIAAHKDGPLYEDLVAILNLEGTAVMNFFREKDKSPFQSVFLERRSLLIFMGDSYFDYYHHIQDKKEDHIDENIVNTHLAGVNVDDKICRGERRLSLTMRIVKFVVEKDLSVETPQQKEEMIRRERFFYQSISEKV